MSWAKLALQALSYVGPPVAEWLARKLSTTQNAEEKAKIAEANRHATQSGAARDASSDATERMMREHKFPTEFAARVSEKLDEPKCPRCGLPQSVCDEPSGSDFDPFI